MQSFRLAPFLFLLALLAPQSLAADPPQLWLYYPIDLRSEKNVATAEPIWARAAAAGYTHIVLVDSKFNLLDQMAPAYFKNCAKAKQIAADLKLQLIPGIAGVGHSNDLLSLDTNLAEGLPVKDQLFIVKKGVAELSAEPRVQLGKITGQDPSVTIDGGVATVHTGKGPARFGFPLSGAQQFRCYHVSVKVKTDGLSGNPGIMALDGHASLQWQGLHVLPTQDWAQSDVIFNSLDHTSISIFFSLGNGAKGALQWKDWAIEEIGLVNVLRRAGSPVVVKIEEGGKVLTEGTDYEPIADPHMGNVPYSGEFQAYHTPPVIHTKLADGTRLRVSWYHPAIFGDGKVPFCLSDPKTQTLLAAQAARLKEIWDAQMYYAARYEFLVCNWDDTCRSRGMTPGQLMAASVRERVKLFEPAGAVVSSDMFDPNHHAGNRPYFLANGSLTESWEGLGKDVVVMNENYRNRAASLKFFAGRGNRQIVACNDDKDLTQLSDAIAVGKNVQGVMGYMYASVARDYSGIEKFAKKVRE